ncbi:TetR/AcrR family transcriptional regulator [Ellagibacter isourolithinifaciens]|uniref:TetR/AcrR family transcriptional regulator n=2 Tax=Ellagibacter isourolithinifaciens TaxID=2137581 RepID=UPI003AF03712
MNDVYEQRRNDIVEAARQLYEERGLSRTSVKDIAERAGITRSLFYHYFPDKQAVTSAVLDDFVEDYIEALSIWNDERMTGEIEQALDGVVRVLRVSVFEGSSFRRALDTRENAALYIEFINRVADRTARYIVDTTVRDYSELHSVSIVHLYETFYILILGICGYIRTHQDVSDEVLKDIIAQSLHMER